MSTSLSRRVPKPLEHAIDITSRLGLNPAWPASQSDAAHALLDLASRLTARLPIDDALLTRLFELWNAAVLAEADEISDWAVSAACTVASAQDNATPTPTPTLIGCGATVYSTGEVLLSVNFEGLDTALWFVEFMDLSAFEQT